MIKFILIISKSDSKATKKVLSVRENVYFFFEVVRTSVDQFTSKHISFSVYFQNGIHMSYSFPLGPGF